MGDLTYKKKIVERFLDSGIVPNELYKFVNQIYDTLDTLTLGTDGTATREMHFTDGRTMGCSDGHPMLLSGS